MTKHQRIICASLFCWDSGLRICQLVICSKAKISVTSRYGKYEIRRLEMEGDCLGIEQETRIQPELEMLFAKKKKKKKRKRKNRLRKCNTYNSPGF